MESSTVNEGALYKYPVLALVWLLKKFRSRRSKVFMLSSRICIKLGSAVSLSEASSLRYIAQHTSIPVPKVYCAFKHGDFTYIVMERLEGDMLGIEWVYRSPESKAKIFQQLRAILEELRSLPLPPNARISNIEGGPVYDGRIPGVSSRYGPFSTQAEFSKSIRGGVDIESNWPEDVEELIALQAKEWPLVFTHGDLSSLNILAVGDKITGIVDWETSGWFPRYWEYATAYQVNPQNSFWKDEIDHFLQPLPDELKIAQTRLKYFNAF